MQNKKKWDVQKDFVLLFDEAQLLECLGGATVA